MISKQFEKWASSYAGCDGGDVGGPNKRSIWLCGIEWGGGHTPEDVRENIAEEVKTPPDGYDSWNENLMYSYNRQVMKLFSAMGGRPVSDFRKFAEDVKPFTCGASGYYKLNLYPIAFKKTSHDLWKSGFADVTGFPSKEEYLRWCNEVRLPVISNWARKHQPAAIICLGKTFKDQFGKAFLVDEGSWKVEALGDRELSYGRNSLGGTVFVLPFVSGPHGLNRNSTIQKFGERIAEIIHAGK
jgi:hypothetical protein